MCRQLTKPAGQKWRRERDTHLLAGNTITILSLFLLRMTMSEFSVLVVAKFYRPPKTPRQILKKHLDSQQSTVEHVEKVKQKDSHN